MGQDQPLTPIGSPDDCDVAVLVPVYLNAGTLRELAQRTTAVLSATGLNHRLLFIVDASPDDSWAVVQHLAAQDSRIAGLLMAVNQGQHRALIAGMTAIRARWLVMMDADLQDPPEVLPELIAAAAASGVTTFARRQGQYQGLGRMLTSRLFKTGLGWTMKMPPDVGTFLVLPADVASRLLAAPVRHPQVVVMARAFSPGWCGVTYLREPRATGESAYSSTARLRAALRGLRCAWECRRAGKHGAVSLERLTHPAIAARVNL